MHSDANTLILKQCSVEVCVLPSPYTVEAIPTKYKTFRYRSKLEAQHAKFFDLLSIDFLYEPELFRFGNQSYLPDFKIFIPDEKVRWIEVKGPMYSEARIKAILLAQKTQGLVQIWAGSWGDQTIYNFEYVSNRVRISKPSRILDETFRYWNRKELRGAYEAAYEV